MAFPVETLTVAKVGLSHILMRANSNDVCQSHRIAIGRVIEVSDVETGETLYKHPGHNATGEAQMARLFKLAQGTGEVVITLDEVKDVDGETWLGEQIDVDLRGVYQAAPTLGWRYLAATAYIVMETFKPNKGTPSTCRLRVIPYAAPGTAAWAFDNAYSTA